MHSIQPRSKQVSITVHWCPVCKMAFENKGGIMVAVLNDRELRDHFHLAKEVNDICAELKLNPIEKAAIEVLMTNFALQQWMDGFKTGILLGLQEVH